MLSSQTQAVRKWTPCRSSSRGRHRCVRRFWMGVAREDRGVVEAGPRRRVRSRRQRVRASVGHKDGGAGQQREPPVRELHFAFVEKTPVSSCFTSWHSLRSAAMSPKSWSLTHPRMRVGVPREPRRPASNNDTVASTRDRSDTKLLAGGENIYRGMEVQRLNLARLPGKALHFDETSRDPLELPPVDGYSVRRTTITTHGAVNPRVALATVSRGTTNKGCRGQVTSAQYGERPGDSALPSALRVETRVLMGDQTRRKDGGTVSFALHPRRTEDTPACISIPCRCGYSGSRGSANSRTCTRSDQQLGDHSLRRDHGGTGRLPCGLG